MREISGLALSDDDRLFAVADEQAIVHELDYEHGRIVKSFALGSPALRGDFEGIAMLHDTIWLMTSNGFLYAAREAEDNQRVRYQRFDTGLGEHCELEGLAQDRQAGTLLLACKDARKGRDLAVFEWSTSRFETIGQQRLPEKAIRKRLDEKNINPSGIAIHPVTDERLMIAARQRALLTLSADGELNDAIILKKKSRHKQAEGIEVTTDGRMLIADEGDGGRARLAVYPSIRPQQEEK